MQLFKEPVQQVFDAVDANDLEAFRSCWHFLSIHSRE